MRSASLGPRGLLLVVLAAASPGCGSTPRREPEPPRYAGSAACASCHAEQHRLWTGSDHQRALARAADGTVLGDFGDARHEHDGVETRFLRREGRFWIRTRGADGRTGEFEVLYALGVRPLQQYLLAFDEGRLQAFTVAWDTERRRWFSLYPKQRLEPGQDLHWTGRSQNGNYMCVECHVTGYEKGYDVAHDAYRTRFAEAGVGCEACHGPAERHVAAHEEGTGKPPLPEARLVVSREATAQLDVCAPCHARRRPLFPGHRPGARFLDHYVPELIHEGSYFLDGQVQGEVYEYGSFLQSRMYAAGVRCADCHDPHSSALVARGNALCGRCHAPDVYDREAHHGHAPGTQGAACVECHMPSRTYMEVDPRRDHGFHSPRPDLSLAAGVPNACSGCHRDRTSAWARDVVDGWPRRRRPPGDWRAALADPRAGPAALAGIVSSAAPGIVRATALELLTPEPAAAAFAGRARLDADPLVRAAAVGVLEAHAPGALPALLRPLLADARRSVRVEAARVLSGAPDPPLPGDEAFRAALGEYEEGLEALADQPAAHLNRAVLREDAGAAEDAEREYRLALRLDPGFAPARVNLALHLVARGRRTEAEGHLRRAVEASPDLFEARHALGLLLAEDPGRLGDAEPHLVAARRLRPRSAAVLAALTGLYSGQGRWTQALEAAEEWSRIDPGDEARAALEALRHRGRGRSR